MQVIITIVLALAAIGGIVLGVINQLQIRRQMQRKVLVIVKQALMQLPRIPDDQGGFNLAPVHAFIIRVANAGLIPVMLKDAEILSSDSMLLAKAFSPRRDKQFPLELAPGDDLEVQVDAYTVLKAIKSNSISGNVVVRGCFITPLKQYKSKKVRLNIGVLSNDIKRTEGAWRKD